MRLILALAGIIIIITVMLLIAGIGSGILQFFSLFPDWVWILITITILAVVFSNEIANKDTKNGGSNAKDLKHVDEKLELDCLEAEAYIDNKNSIAVSQSNGQSFIAESQTGVTILHCDDSKLYVDAVKESIRHKVKFTEYVHCLTPSDTLGYVRESVRLGKRIEVIIIEDNGVRRGNHIASDIRQLEKAYGTRHSILILSMTPPMFGDLFGFPSEKEVIDAYVSKNEDSAVLADSINRLLEGKV